MRLLDFKPKFKKELTNIEIEGIERIVDNYSKNVGGIPPTRFMGFAYTSSSSHAMYNVMEHIEIEDGTIEYFSITENNMLIMVVSDEDENYIYYEIEPRDFN